MTAEIAILNRTAIAFAADSAATLSGPRMSKTYDSAEKIFEVCRRQPIALMVFNNAQFMGVPMEVLVQQFREHLEKADEFAKLTDVWPAFSAFLVGFPRDESDENQHFAQHLYQIWNRIQSGANSLFVQQMGERMGSKARGALKSPIEFMVELAKRHREQADQIRLDSFLENVTFAQFCERFGQVVTDVIGSVAPHLVDEETLLDELRRLMFSIIRSSMKSGGTTGYVFGGFGNDDLFPTLHPMEVDGIYFGQLRTMPGEVIDIDRDGVTAAVVPFAQKDMPQRFIFGIDDGLQRHVERMVAGVVEEIVEAKPRTYGKGLGDQIRDAARNRVREALEQFKAESEQKLKSVVNFMSKRELAEIAYSLVELTSRKRRFSDDQETVGGPIDVAVLTRNEGLIWIRRKHYFDPTLNPAYFVRNSERRRSPREQ